jgi:hypothetical protein
MTLIMSDGRVFTRYGGRCAGPDAYQRETSEAQRQRMIQHAEQLMNDMRSEALASAAEATFDLPGSLPTGP